MKPTQFLELLHTIGKTWVSFVSIAVFVALGAGLYMGIGWAAQAIESAADTYYAQQSFHDYAIDYPYGFTDDQLADLSAIDGATSVEGAYTSFQTFDVDGTGTVARVQSLTSSIDVPDCREGSLPTEPNQVAVDGAFADKNDIHVGDKISFYADGTDADNMAYLTERNYTVAAIVDSPAFVANSQASRGMTTLSQGAADCFLLVPRSSFDAAAFQNAYPTALVRCQSLDGASTFSDRYARDSASLKDLLQSLGDVDAAVRYQELHDKAQATVDEGQKRVDDGKTQIAAGEQRSADAQKSIDEGEAQLADGQVQIDEGDQEASQGEARLENGLQELNYYQKQEEYANFQVEQAVQSAATALIAQGAPGTHDQVVAQLRTILDEAAASGQDAATIARNKGVPEQYVQLYGAQAQGTLDRYRDYLAKKQKLQQGWNTYYYNRQQLDDKEVQLADAKAELAQKQQDLEDAKVQLADGLAQLDDAKAKLADAESRLQDGRDHLAQMVYRDWSIQDRAANAGVVVIESSHDVTDRLRLTMASLFVIVGLLVCYTVISRIVSEEVVGIGTKKALGLRSREITIGYLLYAAIAVVVGVLVGAIVAVCVIEGILDAKSSEQFCMGAIAPYFSLGDMASIGLLELVLICLSAWLACRRMLARQAVDLLKGPEAPTGKVRFYEKWKAWERMPLYSQSMVNNFFNDRLRVFGTLVGIAGCTALIVTAMTLYLNVQGTFDAQYADVTAYTGRVALDAAEGAQARVSDVLDGAGTESAAVYRTTMAIDPPDGKTAALTVEVPDDPASFQQLYRLNDMRGGQAQVEDDGVWLSDAYAQHFGAKAGDTVRVVDSSGTARDLTIAGFFEYHLSHNEAVMSAEYYRQMFDADPAANTVLVSLNGADEESLIGQLKGTDGFFSYTDEFASSAAQFESFQSLTRTVVVIYLALSALMALIVLLNLTVMFIEEKRRDLIVLMINGFSVRQAKRYIYRDNIALTVIGVVLGLIFGMVMGYFSLLSIEFSADSYLLAPSWIACAVGLLCTVVFEFAVNIIALRRIPRFNLTDINKA